MPWQKQFIYWLPVWRTPVQTHSFQDLKEDGQRRKTLDPSMSEPEAPKNVKIEKAANFIRYLSRMTPETCQASTWTGIPYQDMDFI